MNLAVLQEKNAARWKVMKTDPRLHEVMDEIASRLTASEAKSRYMNVQMQTAVPWQFIALIHYRESSQSWFANLANGQRYDRVTTLEPKGRGPFQNWEAAAKDALVNCQPHAASNKDWSIGGFLTMAERYNGLGYADLDQPSPYVWSGSDQYRRGKFIADHHYDPNVIDMQMGVAPLLWRMMLADSSIKVAA